MSEYAEHGWSIERIECLLEVDKDDVDLYVLVDRALYDSAKYVDLLRAPSALSEACLVLSEDFIDWYIFEFKIKLQLKKKKFSEIQHLIIIHL